MTSLRGTLLVATPRLREPIFGRSVILMLEHSEGGAAGVILNRPTDATVSAVAEQVFDEPIEWDKPIGLGGPVSGPLLVLHTEADLGDREILPGVFSTVDAANVRGLVDRKAEPSVALANYAGWGPGQLEGEIEEGSWTTAPARLDLIFWDGDGELWDAARRHFHNHQLTTLLGLREVPDDPSRN